MSNGNGVRIHEGNPIRWVRPGTARGQLRALLRSCDQGRACLFDTRASRRSIASSCPSTPTRCGTATCRMRGPGRSTAIASTGRTSPTRGTASIRNKLLLDPYARRTSARSNGIRPVRLHVGPQDDDLTFDERDSAPFIPSARHRSRLQLARRQAPGDPWDPTIIYEAHVRGFTKLPARARALRGTFAGLARRIVDYITRSASRRSSCCRSMRSSTTATSSRRAHELLGLQHDRILRSDPRYMATASRASSRRWSPAFTTPASR